MNTVKRWFSAEPMVVLDLRKDTPIVRKANWLDRIISWTSNWLGPPKDLFFISKSAKFLSKTLAANVTKEAIAKWRKENIYIPVRTSEEIKENLGITIRKIEELIRQTPQGTKPPTGVETSKQKVEVNLQDLINKLFDLEETFLQDSRSNADKLQELFLCTDSLAQNNMIYRETLVNCCDSFRKSSFKPDSLNYPKVLEDLAKCALSIPSIKEVRDRFVREEALNLIKTEYKKDHAGVNEQDIQFLSSFYPDSKKLIQDLNNAGLGDLVSLLKPLDAKSG